MTFTASAFERVFECPASAALPQVQTRTQWSEEGNEGHGVICSFVQMSSTFSPAESELRIRLAKGVPERWQAVCEELEPWVPMLAPEAAFKVRLDTWQAVYLGSNIGRRYSLEPGEVAGTADLAGKLSPTEVLIIDTKTGWGPVAPPADNRQLRLLAAMAARAWGCKTAKVALLRCPEGVEPSWQWADLDQMDLDATLAEAAQTLERVQEVMQRRHRRPALSEGPWCRYCPAYTHCPAKTALVKRLASGAEMDDLEMMKPLDARTAGLAWSRLGEARRLLARIESACHAALDQFGELELPNGKRLRKVVDDGNEKIDGDTAWHEMAVEFGHDLANEACERKVTKKALGAALRGVLGRSGAAKERELLERWRENGIITRGKVEKLVEFDE